MKLGFCVYTDNSLGLSVKPCAYSNITEPTAQTLPGRSHKTEILIFEKGEPICIHMLLLGLEA